jgi:hypothetical protein
VRRSILVFSIMVKPINNLLKKDQVFSWTPKNNKSFVDIKNATVLAHVLEKPYFSKDVTIYTNSTEEVVYVILLQKDDENVENPIDFMSQSLFDDELKCTLIETHIYALVKAIENFCHFIPSKHTEVKVPLSLVNFLLSQTLLS